MKSKRLYFYSLSSCLLFMGANVRAQAPGIPDAPAAVPAQPASAVQNGIPVAPIAPQEKAVVAPSKPVIRTPVLPPGAIRFNASGQPVFPNSASGVKARKQYNYQIELVRQAAEAKAWNEYVVKMGPIVAAQQRQQFLDQQRMFQLEMEAARTNAAMKAAAAAEKNAEVNRQRLQLEQYEAYQNRYR